MTKKITAIFLALCMAISVLPMTIQAASKPDIKVGDYVKMGAYNNASILWRCVSIDNNGPLMLADKIVDTLAYDAKTNDNSNSKSHSRSYKRDDYGSNYWKDSNMRSWLNSTAAEGKVDWLCGNPPKDGYVSGVGAYNEITQSASTAARSACPNRGTASVFSSTSTACTALPWYG